MALNIRLSWLFICSIKLPHSLHLLMHLVALALALENAGLEPISANYLLDCAKRRKNAHEMTADFNAFAPK